jgi:hypothetical protein
MISKPMVRLAQTAHLSCNKFSTISKWSKTSYHLSLITKAYHRVCSKWFLSLWYIWRKPYTYLAPTLTLSPNGPKRDSTWPTHLGVPSGASKMIMSLWYIQRKPCTYHALRLAVSPNGPKRATTWPLSPRRTIWCAQNDFWAYGMVGANRAPIMHRH